MKEQFSDSALALGWAGLLCSDTGGGKRELKHWTDIGWEAAKKRTITLKKQQEFQ
ncbi:hypothetical protein AMECASPLE_020864, partial [Ameca splendens]